MIIRSPERSQHGTENLTTENSYQIRWSVRSYYGIAIDAMGHSALVETRPPKLTMLFPAGGVDLTDLTT